MSKETFEKSRAIQDAAGPCFHCGGMNVWEKKDAWVED
jgi:hypothetical protein